MTIEKRLREDTVSFPSSTIALHVEAADELEQRQATIDVLDEQISEANQELEWLYDKLNRIVQHIPATHEDYGMVREILQGEQE